MTERPILFNDAMVRAILSGAKTQTRRPVKPQPSVFVPGPNRHAAKRGSAYFDAYCSERKTASNPRGMSDRWCWWTPDDRQGSDWIRCPFGVSGDRLWVRECHGVTTGHRESDLGAAVRYRADGEILAFTMPAESALPLRLTWEKWRPSIHMPRWASRLTLRVTDVRVERVQDITEDDARAEGVYPLCGGYCAGGADAEWNATARAAFEGLWCATYGDASWTANTWVWVVSFDREGGRDA